MTSDLYENGAAHLLDELGYLNLLLRRAVLLLRVRRAGAEPDPLRGMLISEAEIDRLMAPGYTDGSEVADLDDAIEARRAEIRERVDRSRAAGVRLPLAQLAAIYALSDAEKDLLLVGLAPELETFYEISYAYLQNDVTRKRPSVELALDLICRSTEEKVIARRLLSEDSRLVTGRLIQLGDESYDHQPTLLRRFLKMSESTLHFVLEQRPVPPARPAFRDRPDATEPELSASAETGRALGALVDALQRFGTAGSLVHLEGGADAPLMQAAMTLGGALGRDVMIADLDHLAASPDALADFAHEAVLWDALPVLTLAAAPVAEGAAPRPRGHGGEVWQALRDAGLGAVVLGSSEDLRRLPADFRLWRVPVEPPGFGERVALWRAAAPGLQDADAHRLADLYPFAADRIRQAVALARTQRVLAGRSDAAADLPALMRASRSIATPNLQRFAVIVPPLNDWDDLVLPADRVQQLRSVAARVGNRAIVQRDWGFADKQTRGRGVAVLFSGPPGTGKTMAAEIMAKKLSLDLFQIDLSTVMSKYIGETEKQIATIFAEAEQGQCVLFFDECDAIFGKRTEMTDAHARYANTETNYLLQRMEQYDGIVLLATNFQKNIDEAFLRRLHDSVDFPFPDEAARSEIWRRQFPARAPVADIDFAALGAQYRLAGGAIRNAAQYAAYRAAEEAGRDGRIGMDDVLEGVRREFQKMGKLVVASDQTAAARRSLRA